MIERLQKYMACCGIASRRKCENIILQGRVKVNGVTVNKLGLKIDDDRDKVSVDNIVIKKEEKKVYILLNKPVGYISTVKDDRGRNTLLDLVKVKERIYPIGRLDYNTSGLIILTNDGYAYNNIAHPRREKNKIYIALLKGIPSRETVERFKNGLSIDGYVTAAANFKILHMDKNKNTSEVEISIHEGRNRQIRKMCDKIGCPVLSLTRTAIGNIQLGDLKEGNWRYLNKEEIDYIRN
ncbi:pseudouridine synthase [Clostridium luticellarii]|jgi:23S rRNA pseudouridine2605 synthase|nr:pseudouridine synthase [Clostridium luticellarii]MCI1944174.1 rRNA pseudouridine synthase [Clostridium luticellarii]MCI1967676.1 rRNA pseudouridine synthase [Clostridium luticellarii]MCI1994875.1 rRNA pseudouridine synthase [Clostridium luticellarii]MCI2039984.1 rRNA pseudouridine synthase [Clostridium luticellarii]